MALNRPSAGIDIYGSHDPLIRSADVGVHLVADRMTDAVPGDVGAWDHYLAGWRIDSPMEILITAHQNQGRVFIRFESSRGDARCPDPRVADDLTLTIDVMAPSPFPDERSARWVRAMLRWFVLHELDEHIRVDGERIFDPHRDGRHPTPENS